MRIYSGVSLTSGRPYAGVGVGRRLGGRRVSVPYTPLSVATLVLLPRWRIAWMLFVRVGLLLAFFVPLAIALVQTLIAA